MRCADELVDVSCDFEHSFICGYTKTVTETFSWEQTEASDLRYMQKNRGGTNAILFVVFFVIVNE